MKNYIVYLVVILVVAGGILGGYFYSKNKNQSTARTNKINNEPFLWGVTVRPHALAKFTEKSWAQQITLAKELGGKYVRLAWQYDAKPNPTKFLDTLMKETNPKDLSIYLIIENKKPLTAAETPNPYQDGYDSTFEIASHYKGKIKYYQLMNEAASSALKGGQYSGENESDYDPTKYANIRDWLKGASDGIKKADPDAYRIITDQWTHFAFFNMINRDGVGYDIIGWDWFSDMGFMGDKKMSDGRTPLEHLQDFNKPIILAEVNYRPTGPSNNQKVDGAKQAEFMTQMAEWAYSTKIIKGFFVLELMDVTNTGTRGYTDRYGIVEANKNAKGVGEITGKRPAFDAIKQIIEKYSK